MAEPQGEHCAPPCIAVHALCKNSPLFCKDLVKLAENGGVGCFLAMLIWQSVAMHILLIDDDRELCALLGRFLEGDGFTVSLAHDGIEGLAKIQQASYDLAVLDVMMPGKSGMDLLRELRGFSSLPVIMLTARGDEMDRIIGLELG
ncbi:MAG: response regulator, partial [Mariprofundaceae bacterium]|nr:response regulator [Mariprofundaceae bacterium]